MIQVKNLTKYYGDKQAITGLNFTIKRGEVVGLLGLNGSGKTTTIRILSSFLIATEGEAHIDGINVFQNPLEAKKKIGYLPETPPLYKDLTIHEYLQFCARIKGMSESSMPQHIQTCAEQTGIADRLNHLIAHLSLGYRKRVGIAQAILGNPSVIIMDEPVSGLDPKQIVEMRNRIRQLAGEHTILISSHILSEIQKTCDRFLFLKDGQLVYDYSEQQLEQQLDTLSGLNLVLTAASQSECEKVIQSALGEGTVVVDETNETGYSFFIKTTQEKEFKNQLIGALSSTNINLVTLKKQEITLEDFFNRVT